MAVGAEGVIHVNVNCTDLARSLRFYRDDLGLEPVTRTAPTSPQDGAAFGLETAQWDAYIMGGPARFARPVIDLLQWIVPPPAPGRPLGDLAASGFRAIRVGAPEGPHGRHRDPDGTAVDVVPGDPGLSGVVVACTDFERSRRFYEDVLATAGFVELVEDRGAAPAPAAANTLGIWRLALATSDIEADVEELGRRGVRCRSEIVAMSMGPGLPVVRFVLFSDPDGTTIELIERPRT